MKIFVLRINYNEYNQQWPVTICIFDKKPNLLELSNTLYKREIQNLPDWNILLLAQILKSWKAKDVDHNELELVEVKMGEILHDFI